MLAHTTFSLECSRFAPWFGDYLQSPLAVWQMVICRTACTSRSFCYVHILDVDKRLSSPGLSVDAFKLPRGNLTD